MILVLRKYLIITLNQCLLINILFLSVLLRLPWYWYQDSNLFSDIDGFSQLRQIFCVSNFGGNTVTPKDVALGASSYVVLVSRIEGVGFSSSFNLHHLHVLSPNRQNQLSVQRLCVLTTSNTKSLIRDIITLFGLASWFTCSSDFKILTNHL